MFVKKTLHIQSRVNYNSIDFLGKIKEQLTGIYDKGKIFTTQLGVEGGFRIKLENLDVVLHGTIRAADFTDPTSPTMADASFYNNLLFVEAVSQCSITFNNPAKNIPIIWTKVNCQSKSKHCSPLSRQMSESVL